MKLTESKLRYAIRDLLWEASVSAARDPDSDNDGALSSRELRRLADELEDQGHSSGDRGEAALSQAAIDHAGELGASQGRIPFLDWSQLVVDASSKMMGIEDIEDGYDPDTGEQIMPYDAWIKGIDPVVYAQSVDALAPGDMGADDEDYERGFFMQLGILPDGKLGRLLKESLSERLGGGEMYDENPTLPTEFMDDKEEAYINRMPLRQKMSDLEYGPDSAPEDILAIALSNRAEELTGFNRTVDPSHFSAMAMRMYQDYIAGKSGDRGAALQDITTRIDAGGYFDENIMDVSGWQTSSQPPGALSESRLSRLAGLLED